MVHLSLGSEERRSLDEDLLAALLRFYYRRITEKLEIKWFT